MIIETERKGEKYVVCSVAWLREESEKAYFVEILISKEPFNIEAMWLPKSQCSVEKVKDAKNQERIAIEMPRWLAVKKGIVGIVD